MTSSDIIAIVAIVISAIVSIVSVFISYQNTKATINAKRSEIALDRRLNAFSELIEKIGALRLSLVRFAALPSDVKFEKEEFDGLKAIMVEGFESLHIVFERNRVFLPKHISRAVDKFVETISRFSDKLLVVKDVKGLQTFLNAVGKEEEKVVDLMQEFIGLK